MFKIFIRSIHYWIFRRNLKNVFQFPSESILLEMRKNLYMKSIYFHLYTLFGLCKIPQIRSWCNTLAKTKKKVDIRMDIEANRDAIVKSLIENFLKYWKKCYWLCYRECTICTVNLEIYLGCFISHRLFYILTI